MLILLGAVQVVAVKCISETFSSPKFCILIYSLYDIYNMNNMLNIKDDKSHKIGIL